MFLPKEEAFPSRQYMEESILVALGGHAAEEVIFGEEFVTTGATRDFEVATETARQMVQKFGFSSTMGKVAWDDQISDTSKGFLDQEVLELITKKYTTCLAMMVHKKGTLKMLATELLHRKTMTVQEVKDFLSL